MQGGARFTSTYMLLVRPNTGYSPAHMTWGEWSSKWVPADEEALIGPDGSWKGSPFALSWTKGMEQNRNARIKQISLIHGDVLPILPLVAKASHFPI